MQYPNLSEYVKAIANAGDNLAELKHLVPVPDEHGEPYRSSGAFAVVFKMKDPKTGQFYALKCFTEEQEGRAEAYRKIGAELEGVRSGYFTSMRYYERELFVDSSVSSESEFPVLLMEWVEGQTMENYIAKYYQDSYKMGLLCHLFCKMASWLRCQLFAHGDIKPDNIIVGEKGELTLIDYDGMFVPSMAGQSSPTLGTQDFRHPLRKAEDFDATIDDFALASIALSLKAITLDPDLLDRFGAPDRLLFSANDYLDLTTSDALCSIWQLVADQELSKLLSLFLLAHAEQNLAATSFSLFSTSRPEEPVIEVLSTEVTDQDLKEAYTDEYGVKFSPDRKRLLKAPDDLELYVVPNTVAFICDSAFYSCLSLFFITLPKGLKTIGDNAFSECRSLTSITLQEGLKTIGNNAFSGCRSLTSITLQEGLKTIGNKAFRECSSLTSITLPEGLKTIGDRAFGWCYSLTSITLPEGLKTIGDRAFGWCSSLTSITLPEGLEAIGKEAFSRCGSLTSITLPDGLKTIEDEAFYLCNSLTSIILPKSLTNIGKNPFQCLQLKINNLSPHFYIEDDVLFTADKTHLISYCSSKTTYSVPCAVKTIGDSAFGGCDSLTSITLPKGLKTIGDSAFGGCDSLTSITLPEGLKTIGKSAFFWCDSLTSITLPEGLKTIGDSAFRLCWRLTSITLPEGLEAIGDSAFIGCDSLTSITLPKSFTNIGKNPFQGLQLKINNLSPHFYIEDDVLFTADKTHLISYCSSKTTYSVPCAVKTIGDEAFSWCNSLTSITLPEGLKTIGNEAFQECKSLTFITLPEGLKTIGEGAFIGCDSLTSITLPKGLETIGNYAFIRVFITIEQPKLIRNIRV